MCLESSLGTDNRVHVVLFNTYFKIEAIVSWVMITTEGKYPPFSENLLWPCNIALHFALDAPMLQTPNTVRS